MGGIFLLLGLAILYIPWINIHAVSPDSNLYINIGKHLLQGHPVCTFDIYQTSPNPSFPSAGFVPPLWPLLSAMGLNLLGTNGAHIINSAFILGSAYLYYLLARSILPSPLSGFITLIVFTSSPFLSWVTYPWTEGLGFFLFSFLVYLLLVPVPKQRKAWLLSLLLTALFLTRIQFFLPALLLTSLLSPKQEKKRTLFLTGSFCLLAFSILSYIDRAWYPWLYTTCPNRFHIVPSAVQKISISGALLKILTPFLNSLSITLSPWNIGNIILLFFPLIWAGWKLHRGENDKTLSHLFLVGLITLLSYPFMFLLLGIKETLTYVITP